MSNFNYGYEGMELEYYGSYRNKKFADFYPTFEDFYSDYKASGFFDKKKISDGVEPVYQDSPEDIGEDLVEILWRLLYARYGNSTIANADETQFKFRLFSIIFQYGPTWKKKLEIQRNIRGLSAEDLETGNTHIMNHAFNPSTDPTTKTQYELPYVNEQNVSKFQRGKLDQYDYVLQLLKQDVTETFLKKFRVLFLTVVAPEIPLWYTED